MRVRIISCIVKKERVCSRIMIRKVFTVEGMHCAGCSARVERTVRNLPGVLSANVNLVEKKLFAEFDDAVIVEKEIEAAVGKLGFCTTVLEDEREETGATESPSVGWRAMVSLLLLAPLLYCAMGEHMGVVISEKMTSLWFQAILATAIMGINIRLIVAGWQQLLVLHPDMNSLIALGACSAWGYGVYGMFATGQSMAFESAASVVAFISLGKYLEARTFRKTRNAVDGLRRLLPETAVLTEGDTEREVRADLLKEGDTVLVRTGESIPADGIIAEGRAAVDLSAVTGESMPVDLSVNDEVFGGGIVVSGLLKVRVVHAGKESMAARMVRMVQEAGADKAPISRVADRISFYFVPTVVLLALGTLTGWLLYGAEMSFAFDRMLAVLVVSCPCALGLATPIAVMLGAERGARLGILSKNAAVFEIEKNIDTVVFDKTGTLTEGHPEVDRVLLAEGVSHEELLTVAAALERNSEHPLARAVVRAAEDRKIAAPAARNPQIHTGQGITGEVDGIVCGAGSAAFLKDLGIDLPLRETSSDTPIELVHGGKWIGCLFLRDLVRGDAKGAVDALRAKGIQVILLSGDREAAANAVARYLGIDRVKAEVLPNGKVEFIRALRRQGCCVAMVGDGVNDAPALSVADLGIAFGSGTDIAMDAADVALLRNHPSDVVSALRLGNAVMHIIRQNLFWAFSYNVVGIPLAAGVLYPLTGILLPPVFAAVAMCCSSLLVVGNSLRLIRFKKHL